ncbi:DNA topoisomerase 1 alpha-like isoform X2 [Magnolia sinica]|uniref:DNA topoisomerase 1 alpha-like isoform X2 n=1 Tax=Magnolia sinica TaxID=86752 RepID=UPI0026580909|nr:DNA topoisomerase 1 alpha-like isoform X2 [Magnolia sinica]
MAVHGCMNQNHFDDDDEDDELPLVFKRRRPAPWQNQLKSTIKKLPSQRHDRLSASDRRNSNLSNHNVALPEKVSRRRSTVTNLKTSISCRSKHSSERDSAAYDKEKKLLYKSPVESAVGPDDNIPLYSRIPTASVAGQKRKFSHLSEDCISSVPSSSRPEKTKTSIEKSADDSEDEKPLSSKLSKSGICAFARTSYNSDDEKTLSDEFQQDGSGKGNSDTEQSFESTIGLNKRLVGEVNSSPQSSSIKKLKIYSASSFSEVMQECEVNKEAQLDDDDYTPIAQRMRTPILSDNRSSLKLKIVSSSFKKTSSKVMENCKHSKLMKVPPGFGGGQKWTTLEHNGVIFPPPYKPHGVKMLYNGQPVDLTPEQEEVATMFAVMKDTEYATKQKFIDNFMNDWRMILGQDHVIKKFEFCDFTPIYEWHQKEKEKKKEMSKTEKRALKEEKLKQEEKYMCAIVDGIKEKVGNFRVEPPGLFRGRGEHPKMGKLKRRIQPSDITINIGKDAPIPECPIPGERWKEIKHDNTVTWLAFWNDPINPKESKYVFLAACSSLKGQSDKEKYEKARLLKNYIHGIRETYTRDFVSRDLTKRQIAVATYLIDKLALRAGNDKDDDEADTVGCCTMKVENVTLLPPNKLQFDFLGKDSIRYFNTVEVERPVYNAIAQFQIGKKEGACLFDKLDSSKLNAHLKELMPGLTAKVFRTYNASITLDCMLNEETKDGSVAEKIAVYQQANKKVAIICNHQRSVSKSHGAQMSRLSEKIAELKD